LLGHGGRTSGRTGEREESGRGERQERTELKEDRRKKSVD